MCSGSDAPGSSTVPRGNRGTVSTTALTLRLRRPRRRVAPRRASAGLAGRAQRGERVGDPQDVLGEAEDRGRAPARGAGGGGPTGGDEDAAAGQDTLQVGGRDAVPEGGGVEVAQLRDRELRGGEREADVGVGELGAQAVDAVAGDRA